MLGMSWDRPGAGPLVHMALLGFPITDPEFYAVRQTVLDVRGMTSKDEVVPLLEEILPAKSRFPGPVGVFLDRVASLQWHWDGTAQQFVDAFGALCPWSASPQELDFRMAHCWQSSVASQVQGRRDFNGLQQADFALTHRGLVENSFASPWVGPSLRRTS